MKRIQKYPLELLDEPEETMTVIGSDGKVLRYTYWFGRVEISAKNARTIYDADEFMIKIGNL